MRPVAVEKWGIDPATKAAQITREQKQALVDLCKHWQVPVSALGDKEHAVITAGGVDVREVEPRDDGQEAMPVCTLPGRSSTWTPALAGITCTSAWSSARGGSAGYCQINNK